MKELILNEQELIRKCIKGDRHAQEFLFNSHYRDLYLIAMRYLSDHQDAEDAIILAFTKVFKSLVKFKNQGPGSLGKWIRTILINESLRILNKKKVLYFQPDLTFLEPSTTAPDALQNLQAADVLSMIEQLPVGYRTVFNLYVIEGYTHSEIGNLLNISVNTSKTQLKKARHHLSNTIKTENANGTF